MRSVTVIKVLLMQTPIQVQEQGRSKCSAFPPLIISPWLLLSKPPWHIQSKNLLVQRYNEKKTPFSKCSGFPPLIISLWLLLSNLLDKLSNLLDWQATASRTEIIWWFLLNQSEDCDDCINHFPIDLEPNKIPFGPNQSENGKYNPIRLIWQGSENMSLCF